MEFVSELKKNMRGSLVSNNLFQIRPTKEFIKEFPEREYFDIDEYIEAGLVVKGGITIINGGRNIGKTTGTLIK